MELLSRCRASHEMSTHRSVTGILDLRHVADQFFNGIDDMSLTVLTPLNRSGLILFLSDFLQSYDQIDGIDAVKIQVFVQSGLKSDVLRSAISKSECKLPTHVLEDVIPVPPLPRLFNHA